MKHKLVIADLPNAGMCNLLFTWAKALIFAEKNNLHLEVYGWNQIHIGPWIRKERVKRFYGNYFKAQKTFSNWLKFRIYKKFHKEDIVLNPPLDKEIKNNKILFYSFNFLPTPNKEDYFTDLHQHRKTLKNELLQLIKTKHIRKFKKLPPLYIAVHIRRGDFKKHPMFVENEYFIDCIKKIRNKKEQDLPVTIFSDGYSNEFEDILALGNVNIAEDNSDIVDLLYLSSCKILVTSLFSTFSYWAAYLSDADIILHPNHIGGSIRGKYHNGFEGDISSYM